LSLETSGAGERNSQPTEGPRRRRRRRRRVRRRTTPSPTP